MFWTINWVVRTIKKCGGQNLSTDNCPLSVVRLADKTLIFFFICVETSGLNFGPKTYQIFFRSIIWRCSRLHFAHQKILEYPDGQVILGINFVPKHALSICFLCLNWSNKAWNLQNKKVHECCIVDVKV